MRIHAALLSRTRASTIPRPTCCAAPPKRFRRLSAGAIPSPWTQFPLPRAPGREHATGPEGGSPPRQGRGSGRRQLLRRIAHRVAGARSLEAVPAGRSEGGYATAQKSGTIDAALEAVADAKAEGRLVASPDPGRRQQVPQSERKMLDAPRSRPLAAWPSRSRRSACAPNATQPRPGTPSVLLLNGRPQDAHGARQFCQNFFGCAGFDIVESAGYAGTRCRPRRAVQFRSEYLDAGAGSLPKVKVPVIVAGNPKDQIEALTAAGVVASST